MIEKLVNLLRNTFISEWSWHMCKIYLFIPLVFFAALVQPCHHYPCNLYAATQKKVSHIYRPTLNTENLARKEWCHIQLEDIVHNTLNTKMYY